MHTWMSVLCSNKIEGGLYLTCLSLGASVLGRQQGDLGLENVVNGCCRCLRSAVTEPYYGLVGKCGF